MQESETPAPTEEATHELTLCYSTWRMTIIGTKEWWRQLSEHQQPVWIVFLCVVLLFFKAPHPIIRIFQDSLFAKGFWLGVLALSVFQLIQNYLLVLNGWVKWGNKEVRYRFDENGVHLHSAGWSISQGWKTCFYLWRRDDFWIVYNSDGSPFMLPTKELSEELKSYLTQKIEENKGRIV